MVALLHDRMHLAQHACRTIRFLARIQVARQFQQSTATGMEGRMLRRREAIARYLQAAQQCLYRSFEIVEIRRARQLAEPRDLRRATESDAHRAAFVGETTSFVDRQVAAPDLEEAQAGPITLAILLYSLHQAAHQRQAHGL